MKNEKKKEENLYNLNNLTEEHLAVIQRALDVYSRLGILQLDRAILDELRFDDNFDFTDKIDTIENYLEAIKRLMITNHKDKSIAETANYNGNLTGWSMGIANDKVSKNIKLAYETFKSIAHTKWKVNNKEKEKPVMSVHSDEGLKLTDIPRINVEVITPRMQKLKNILK